MFSAFETFLLSICLLKQLCDLLCLKYLKTAKKIDISTYPLDELVK